MENHEGHVNCTMPYEQPNSLHEMQHDLCLFYLFRSDRYAYLGGDRDWSLNIRSLHVFSIPVYPVPGYVPFIELIHIK